MCQTKKTKINGGGPVCIQGLDFLPQYRRKGFYTLDRFSDSRIQTAASWTLNTSSYSSGRATDASLSSRRAGGTKTEGNIAVDPRAERDAPHPSRMTYILGVCPESAEGEVQEIYHPYPGQHRRLALRATFSVVAAAPKGNRDWLKRTFHRRRSS